MRASGSGGELRYGYQRAAVLGPWVIESEDRVGFVFRAELVEEHPVWLGHRPLDLILALGPVEWTWRGVEPATTDGTVRIVLDRKPDAVADRVTG